MIRRLFPLVSAALAFGLAACSDFATPAPSALPAPTATVVPSTPTAADPPVPTAVPSSTPAVAPFAGTAQSFDRLSLMLPAGVAAGGTGTIVAKADADSVAPWDAAPEHIQFTLDGYTVRGALLQPQIFVYPAGAYAQLQQNGAAAKSLERLRTLVAQPAGQAVTKDQLPWVPFFNAAQIIVPQIKRVDFQKGRGVRVVTQYAQGLVAINNHELFYHFEGLTHDGQYYVVAILPVTAPALAENADPGAAVPAGGVPMPDLNSANPDIAGYYAKVQQMLDGVKPGAFSPSLDQLDALIGSLTVASN